jgi:hypothetical protein
LIASFTKRTAWLPLWALKPGSFYLFKDVYNWAILADDSRSLRVTNRHILSHGTLGFRLRLRKRRCGSMEKEQVNWGNVGIRMVQGLTTVIETIRQLDVQEASLVMRLLGKSCCKMMANGVGHHFGLALIDASAQIAVKDKLVLEDVISILTSIIGRLYLVASSDEERTLVAQLEEVVKTYQVV